LSAYVLTAAYTLHMAATTVWIGGLFFLVFLLPSALHHVDPTVRRTVLRTAVRRFLPLAWLCLAVFAGTGLTQMSASPEYEGLLAIGNPWSLAILVKHVLVAAMAGVLAWQTWGLLPALERAALGLDPRGDGHVLELERRGRRALNLSLAIGLLVLFLTAAARTAA
jgi:uncharacterized membrane protein